MQVRSLLKYWKMFTNVILFDKIFLERSGFMNSKKIGVFIKERRIDAKITQEELAKDFSIDRSLISKYEKGVSLISTNYLINYSHKYNISCDYLLGKIDEKITLKIKEKN